MILIKSNDDFNLNNIISLLRQKKFSFVTEGSAKHFFELDLFFDDKNLKINSSRESIVLKLPISIELFFFEIKNLFINKFVNIDDFKYEPIRQSIIYNGKIINLNYIHNIIISNLILNLNEGIDKFLLYQLIWPDDKDTQINKLDTHLTNLKNKLKNEISLDLNISSINGIIKLRIN